ncbi:hypothetical protein CISIN_1g0376012mg, partial [Citrus sinensis]
IVFAELLIPCRHFVDETSIIRSVKDIFMVTKERIFKFLQTTVAWLSNPSYIRSWLDLLSQTPRVAPFISKNDPFIMALKKGLDDLISLFRRPPSRKVETA